MSASAGEQAMDLRVATSSVTPEERHPYLTSFTREEASNLTLLNNQEVPSMVSEMIRKQTPVEKYFWAHLQFLWQPASYRTLQQAITAINTSDPLPRSLAKLPPGLLLCAALHGAFDLGKRPMYTNNITMKYLTFPSMRCTELSSARSGREFPICGRQTRDGTFKFCPHTREHLLLAMTTNASSPSTPYRWRLSGHRGVQFHTMSPGELEKEELSKCTICMGNFHGNDLEAASASVLPSPVMAIKASIPPYFAWFGHDNFIDVVDNLRRAHSIVRDAAPLAEDECPSVPIRLVCGHVFGDACLNEWFQTSKRLTCCLCRKYLLPAAQRRNGVPQQPDLVNRDGAQRQQRLVQGNHDDAEELEAMGGEAVFADHDLRMRPEQLDHFMDPEEENQVVWQWGEDAMEDEARMALVINVVAFVIVVLLGMCSIFCRMLGT